MCFNSQYHIRPLQYCIICDKQSVQKALSYVLGDVARKRFLKEDAVPSVFIWNETRQKKIMVASRHMRSKCRQLKKQLAQHSNDAADEV